MLLQSPLSSAPLELPTRPGGFLARLPARDLADLVPFLEPLSATRGTVLSEFADRGEYLYFPQGPLISLRHERNVEVALVGSEGLVGWPALVGSPSSPFRAVVCGHDGIILRLRTERFHNLAAVRSPVALLLSSYLNVIGLQMAETIGAGASHRLELRLARWILLRHDRMSGDDIPVHHDDIATNLGTRRASITDTLHVLEGAGHVRGRRGRLIVRDRTGLEALVGGCYGSSENFYRATIGAFGKLRETPANEPRLTALVR